MRYLTLAERDDLQDWMEARPAQCAFCLGWLDRFGMSGTKANRFFDFVVAGSKGEWTLVALAVHGALLCVMEADEPSTRRLGVFFNRRRETFQTLVGPDRPIEILTETFHNSVIPPRVVQPQVLMARHRSDDYAHPATLEPSFRRAAMSDLAIVVDATLSMHAEEIGVPNTDQDIEALIRSTYQKLQEGRVWLCESAIAGKIDFKASIALPTASVSQIEGVWTEPSQRGRGVARRCLRLMCEELHETVPMLALTVGAENHAALRVYAGLGFETVCAWRTVYLDD